MVETHLEKQPGPSHPLEECCPGERYTLPAPACHWEGNLAAAGCHDFTCVWWNGLVYSDQ